MTYCARHFEMQFLKRKVFYFHSNLTAICEGPIGKKSLSIRAMPWSKVTSHKTNSLPEKTSEIRIQIQIQIFFHIDVKVRGPIPKKVSRDFDDFFKPFTLNGFLLTVVLSTSILSSEGKKPITTKTAGCQPPRIGCLLAVSWFQCHAI